MRTKLKLNKYQIQLFLVKSSLREILFVDYELILIIDLNLRTYTSFV